MSCSTCGGSTAQPTQVCDRCVQTMDMNQLMAFIQGLDCDIDLVACLGTIDPKLLVKILLRFQCIMGNLVAQIGAENTRNTQQQATINNLVKRVEYLESR